MKNLEKIKCSCLYLFGACSGNSVSRACNISFPLDGAFSNINGTFHWDITKPFFSFTGVLYWDFQYSTEPCCVLHFHSVSAVSTWAQKRRVEVKEKPRKWNLYQKLIWPLKWLCAWSSLTCSSASMDCTNRILRLTKKCKFDQGKPN